MSDQAEPAVRWGDAITRQHLKDMEELTKLPQMVDE